MFAHSECCAAGLFINSKEGSDDSLFSLATECCRTGVFAYVSTCCKAGVSPQGNVIRLI